MKVYKKNPIRSEKNANKVYQCKKTKRTNHDHITQNALIVFQREGEWGDDGLL